MNVRIPRALRASPIVLVVLVVVALGAGPVSAGTEISRSGKVGSYSLNDGPDFSPVFCEYDTDTAPDLQRIWLHSLTVYARNRTAATHEQQVVGLKVYLQRKRTPSSAWKDYGERPLIKTDAWDDQSAYFGGPPVTEFAGFTNDNAAYRIWVKINWYKPNGTTIAGWVKARYTWYTSDDGGAQSRVHNCPVTLNH